MSEKSEDDDIYKYLRGRGCKEEVIEFLIMENIDCSTILSMAETNAEELNRLFPRLGDRFAVVDFCKRKAQGLKKRKSSLLDKLREKMYKKSRPKEDLTSSLQISSDEELHEVTNKHFELSGAINKKSRKNTRLVEIGWLTQKPHSDNFTQVRRKQKGGTRKVQLMKTSTKDDILRKGLDLFFPNNSSCLGGADSFIFNILDFQQNELPNDLSVEDMFTTTGLPVLRFYLSSKLRKQPLTNTVTSGDFEALRDDSEILINETVSYQLDTQTYDFSTDKFDDRLYGDTDYVDMTEGNVVLEGQLDSSVDVGIDFIISSTDTTSSLIGEIGKGTHLVIHRRQAFLELVSSFLHLPKECGPLTIEMVLSNGLIENGVDAGGVLRDCLCELWTTFYEKFTEGTAYKIPIISHDFGEQQWVSVAKILWVGWQQEKYFPINIAPSFIERCIFPTYELDLKQDFLNTLSSSDRTVLEEAAKDFSSVGYDGIIDVFSNLNSKSLSTQHNLKVLINEIAHRDIIQTPAFIIECWAPILKKPHLKKSF